METQNIHDVNADIHAPGIAQLRRSDTDQHRAPSFRVCPRVSVETTFPRSLPAGRLIDDTSVLQSTDSEKELASILKEGSVLLLAEANVHNTDVRVDRPDIESPSANSVSEEQLSDDGCADDDNCDDVDDGGADDYNGDDVDDGGADDDNGDDVDDGGADDYTSRR